MTRSELIEKLMKSDLQVTLRVFTTLGELKAMPDFELADWLTTHQMILAAQERIHKSLDSDAMNGVK